MWNCRGSPCWQHEHQGLRYWQKLCHPCWMCSQESSETITEAVWTSLLPAQIHRPGGNQWKHQGKTPEWPRRVMKPRTYQKRGKGWVGTSWGWSLCAGTLAPHQGKLLRARLSSLCHATVLPHREACLCLQLSRWAFYSLFPLAVGLHNLLSKL